LRPRRDRLSKFLTLGERYIKQRDARQLLGKGKFGEARKSLEELIPQLDAAQRADALCGPERVACRSLLSGDAGST